MPSSQLCEWALLLVDLLSTSTITLGDLQEGVYPVIPAYTGIQHQSCLMSGISPFERTPYKGFAPATGVIDISANCSQA